MKRYFILLVSVLALFACKKEQEFHSEGTPYFSIVVLDDGVLPVAELDPMSAQFTLNMSSNAYSSTEKASKHISKALRFHIRSNLRWKVLPADGEKVSWVHPFPESGEEDGIFFFKAERNIDPVDGREAMYNIFVDDGTGVYEPLEGTLIVKQSKSDEFLELSAARINATSGEQTQKLKILANVDWSYTIAPTAAYGTKDLEWLADSTKHQPGQQIDTLNFKLAENIGAIRGADVTIRYKLNGEDQPNIVIPVVQYPTSEVQLDGFPVKWEVRVSEGTITFDQTFPTNGTIPPVSGTGMITFHNEVGKAADIEGNVKLDVTDNSPRATGVWPGDYCEFVAASPVPEQTVIKLSFATRSSSGGMKYWRLEFRDGEEWKPAGELYTNPDVKGPDGQAVKYTHEMIDGSTNLLVDAVVTYTQPTDQVEFRFICAANYRVSGSPVGGNPPAPNSGTWRLSVDSDSADDEYQPCISVISAGAEPPTAAKMSVSSSYLAFEGVPAGGQDLLVTSNQSFKVKTSQKWIRTGITESYAGESIPVKVTCDPNTTTKLREGSVTIVSGITRYDVAIIQAGNPTPTACTFPVKWSFPASHNVKGTDYDLINPSGSYVYSDTHEGLLMMVRQSSSDPCTKPPTYLARDNWGGKHALLQYGTNKGDYWLFELYMVKNAAGTYTIDYKVESSSKGPKYFALEYSIDGTNWTIIDGKNGTYKYESEGIDESFVYTYAITKDGTVQNVSHSFRLPKLSDYTTVSVRARVASVSRMSGSPMPINNGATTRVGDHITVSFAKD